MTTEYHLIHAIKGGERKVFTASIGQLSFGESHVMHAFVSGCKESGDTYEAVLAEEGWMIEWIDPMPEDYITETKEWQLGSEWVQLEVSDTPRTFKSRLNVRQWEGEWVHGPWRGSKSNETTSADGRYAWFWDYWDGYFPTNRLIKLEVVSDTFRTK